jgi:hypothetical protein
MIVCIGVRPERTSSSIVLSNPAESLPSGQITGLRRSMSFPQTGEPRSASRAVIALRLPQRVLISPLWAIIRNGWANGQLGSVLVE